MEKKQGKEVKEYSDEIVRSKAFVDYRSSIRWKKTIPKYKKVKCNDFELYKLKYMGCITANYNILTSLYGQPQIIEKYNSTFRFEVVWYIKFINGTITCISKNFKRTIEPKYNEQWKISGTSENSMKYLILMLL